MSAVASRPDTAPSISEAGLDEDPAVDPDDFSMDDPEPDFPGADLPVQEVTEAGGTPAEGTLLSLNEALALVPEELRQKMEDLLRAEFREVVRWTPPKT